MSMMLVDDHTLMSRIGTKGVVLVDFSAAWCPPCKVLQPILEELSEEWGDRAAVLKIDCDDSPQAAAAYGVMSMPTVIVFKDGEPMEKLVGLRPKEVYRTAVSRCLT